MARQTWTRFKCDACNFIEDRTGDFSEPPARWAECRLKVRDNVSSEYNRLLIKEVIICPDCEDKVRTILMGGKE